jgi:hypothetical protein
MAENGAEHLDVDPGSSAGHRGEFLARDEPAAVPQRDHLADAVTIAGRVCRSSQGLLRTACHVTAASKDESRASPVAHRRRL